MKKLILTLTLILCSFVVSGKKEKLVEFTGTATWYGYRFHGGKTASGEIYNMNSMTCAVRDRSIPLGTKLRITNLKTNKSIVVRVNNRMALRAKHSVDLSTKAFKLLAPMEQGVIKVKVKQVK